MNLINKSPIDSLGYDFIDAKYLPKGKNEYYLRNKQNNNGIHYRELTAYEIDWPSFATAILQTIGTIF